MTKEQGIPPSLPGCSSLARFKSLSYQNTFKSCDFARTLEQLAGKIQSSPPLVFLTLSSILGVSCLFMPYLRKEPSVCILNESTSQIFPLLHDKGCRIRHVGFLEKTSHVWLYLFLPIVGIFQCMVGLSSNPGPDSVLSTSPLIHSTSKGDSYTRLAAKT